MQCHCFPAEKKPDAVQDMEIVIEDGRKQDTFGESTKILVDIYRSTTTIPIILRNGAKEVYPTEFVEEARDLKRKNPEFLAIGERLGFRVPLFDYGNSPSRLWGVDFTGKSVIFTSTNGTKVLRKLIGTGDIFLSSFVNVSATVAAVKGADKISIVASNRPDGKADEDYIFAEYLRDLLLGKNPDLDQTVTRIKKSRGSKWLKVMGFRKDIEYSLRIDSADFPVAFRDGRIIRL